MPCRDDARVPVEVAGLCAVIGALVRLDLVAEVMAHVDWLKAGITQDELNAWWLVHKQRDTTELQW